MNVSQWIYIVVMAGLCIYSFFKIANALNKENHLSGMLGLFIIMLISLTSLFLIIIVMEQNEKLERQSKGKCPEYQKIENVYILKK